MNKNISFKELVTFLFPEALIILLTWIFLKKTLPGVQMDVFFKVFPFLVFIGGILLGWRFHRVKLIYGTLYLSALIWLFYSCGSSSQDTHVILNRYLDMAIILLPFNYLFLAHFKDRSLFSSRGLLFLILIPVQALFICAIESLNPVFLTELIALNLLPGTLKLPVHSPHLVYLFIPPLLIWLFIRYLHFKTALESGMFWSLIAVFIGLFHPEHFLSVSTWISSGILIFIISVLELSYRLAFHDELTGLPGRRSLNKTFLELGNKYTIAMVDIDFFKKFNDKYGHDTGDEVLRMVAGLLNTVKNGGKVFRYGGEEFSVIFPGRSKKEAQSDLEGLRKLIAKSKFTPRTKKRATTLKKGKKTGSGKKKTCRITVSIGVAERNQRLKTPAAVIKAADKALYKAKKAGRNRVVG